MNPSEKKEADRVMSLQKYDILDTPPDDAYDHVVKMVARLLNMPIAVVSLVDTDRIWFKSAFGLSVPQIEREMGLCASAILSEEFYMVEDALRDPRTLHNSLVTSEFGLRFYAAAPLTTSEGYNLGTLCVLDKQPRTLTPDEQQLLTDMAAIVMQQLEMRLMARLAINSQNKMAYMVTHDVRSAVCHIPSLVEMIKASGGDSNEIAQIGDMITMAAEKSMQAVDSFLAYANSMSKDIVYRFDIFDFSELVSQSVSDNDLLAAQKRQWIEHSVEAGIPVNGDRTRLSELVNNLLSNAIKYSPPGKCIKVSLHRQDRKTILEVADEGLGMSSEDLGNAFRRFGKLSAKPTGDEASTGLGLWIVREITERHAGKVTARSKGKHQGAVFTVVLPAPSI